MISKWSFDTECYEYFEKLTRYILHNHNQLLSFLMNVSFLITFLFLLLIVHTWLCVTFISRAMQQFYLCCCAPLHQLLSAWAHPVLACCRAKCTTPPVPAESLTFQLPRTPSVWPIYRDAQWSQGCSGAWLENITSCFYYSCPVNPHPINLSLPEILYISTEKYWMERAVILT